MQYARISKGEFGNALQQLLKSMAGKAQWSDVRTLMEEKLGLGASIPLTMQEEEALMAALQDVMDSRTKDVKTLYATFDHFTNLIFQIYSIKYGVGWTTYSHSGNPVPLFAIGAGADAFVNKGWLDNTNIPRIIADIVE
jgi:alkaline phosphatase